MAVRVLPRAYYCITFSLSFLCFSIFASLFLFFYRFLDVTTDDLLTIISGSKYVWDQACFFNLSAEKLLAQLVEHHMSEENASVFAQVWHKFRGSLVEKLRNQSFGAPLALADIEWRLQVSMAHDKLSKTKHVNTILDLHLADPSGATSSENLLLELNKEQLLELYENLELIQGQVDKITK